jgi:integrase
MNAFDVRIHTIRRRKNKRRPFEVRWRVAGRDKSKSFLTRTLADSYRAELVRAARQGLEFDPATGEPLLWAVPGPAATTWLEHAVGYARMKWPRLAPHSRASLADALATVTVALTRPTAGRPPTRTLRAALYRHAFNSCRHAAWTDPAPARALAWLARASLPVAQLSDPGVIRAAMDALTVRLDGGRAAAATVSRKRAVFHDALGYAVELGLLPANPLGQVQWTAPRSATAVNPQTVASPAQVRAILAEVARLRPELTAFFGCLYYAALRPEEAVALRQANLILPAHRRGKLILTESCPRTGSAWTSTGTPHEPRGLKHRPDGAVRAVPIPPVLAGLLRQHLREFGTAPDGRLFRGARGGILSESTYGRIWHAARETALGPELAATPLARRPYDLRHAALSLWLSATSAPAEVAARAGNSIHVLQDVYAHCVDGRGDVISQQIEDALDPASSIPHRSQCVTASGYTHRRYQPDPVRYMSVNYPTGARMAHNHPASHTRPGPPRCFL